MTDEILVGSREIAVTNPDKILDKDGGIKKIDLVRYYQKIAGMMLPHLKDRLISMLRFPDGPAGEKFFQKNMPGYFPGWIKCTSVRGTCYAVVREEAGIVYLANQVVEPHIMVTRADKADIPDKLVFDFDPSVKDVDLLKETVLDTKSFLEEIGLTPYIMATGGKGYHVAAPIKREMTAAEVRGFALKISAVLAGNDPEHLTTELNIAKRKGRIFIDVNRISPMQTAIAPYAARAKPRLTTATPFSWNRLKKTDPDSLTIADVPKKDAWKDFSEDPASLKKIVRALKR